MRKFILFTTICLLGIPLLSRAQGLGDSIYSLNSVLDRLFDEMMPLCSRMIDVGRAVGGFAALWYIAIRVWKHLAQAEPIDFFPLLRPFAIGLAILLFPQVIALMNGVLQPTVVATRQLSQDSRNAIIWNIEQQEQAIKETPEAGVVPDGKNDDMDKYEPPGNSEEGGGFLSSVFSLFNIKKMIMTFITDVVQVFYSAAALCINTIRTFYLIVLVILGPLVLGLSIFDGFQHTLASWFARYINVFMWLPVANIFGGISSKILENVMTLDQDFFSSVAYCIFMLISIVGYLTVPSVAGYIIQAGGGNSLLKKVNDYTSAGVATAAKALL